MKPNYTILTVPNDKPRELEELVNDYINQGYRPLGGPVIRQGTISGAYWSQAMLLHESKPYLHFNADGTKVIKIRSTDGCKEFVYTLSEEGGFLK